MHSPDEALARLYETVKVARLTAYAPRQAIGGPEIAISRTPAAFRWEFWDASRALLALRRARIETLLFVRGRRDE